MHSSSENNLSDNLLGNDAIEQAAKTLSGILAKLIFEQSLAGDLAQLKTQLEDGTLSAQDYLKSEKVKDAVALCQSHNQYFFPGALRLWWQQPHSFSHYEKTFLMLSSLVLMAGLILSYEIFVLFFDGKPRLEATGDGIKEYCTGELTGLAQNIVNICSALGDNVTAVFNLDKKIDVLPSFSGLINASSQGLVPGASFQTVPSWFNPIGWVNFFTCQAQNTVIAMTGHTFPGSLTEAQARASNGFPVIVTNVNTIPDPFLGNTTALAVNAFLGMFCLLLQNGGYSIINNPQNKPYGHFDGFERFGDDFKFYAYAFAAVYCLCVVPSFVTMAALQCKKALSKWESSSNEREVASLRRKACDLFDEFSPVQVVIRSASPSI